MTLINTNNIFLISEDQCRLVVKDYYEVVLVIGPEARKVEVAMKRKNVMCLIVGILVLAMLVVVSCARSVDPDTGEPYRHLDPNVVTDIVAGVGAVVGVKEIVAPFTPQPYRTWMELAVLAGTIGVGWLLQISKVKWKTAFTETVAGVGLLPTNYGDLNALLEEKQSDKTKALVTDAKVKLKLV